MLKSTLDSLDCLSIQQIDHPIDNEITITPSKSVTHRALLITSLANGTSKITNPLIADDTLFTLQALKAMGVEIQQTPQEFIIHGTSGDLKASKQKIYVENSGSSFRFLTTLASLAKGKTVLTGNSRLCERPIKGLVDALLPLGVKINYLSKAGFPPIEVLSNLSGGQTYLNGDISSQYFSSILMSAPYAKENITIKTKNLNTIKSKPYINLTVDMMNHFGVQVESDNDCFYVDSNQYYEPKNYHIEGDFTNASYFFSVAAILGGRIRIFGLNKHSSQGDIVFLKLLNDMGCEITCRNNFIQVERAPEKPLKGIKVNMGGCPDIVQSLAIVACFASSPTTIHNINHLKFKETDRLNAMSVELAKIGVKTEINETTLKIYPIQNPKPTIIETYNDHRMAMSFSIIGLKIPDIVIKNPDCVNKSFPKFFDTLKILQ